MRRFLELYQGTRSPKLLAQDFREQVGDETFEALLRADVLKRNARATRYPCDGGGFGCPRRIVPTFGHPRSPWVAVCGQPFPECLDVPLTEAELEEYVTSHEQFALTLRRVMKLGGSFALLDAKYPDTAQLGELDDPPGVHDVFLCLGSWGYSLSCLLAERMLVQRPSLVLVPTPKGIPIDLVHRYAPGGHVTLGFLVDVLDVVEGEVVARSTLRALTKPTLDHGIPSCRLHTAEGVRLLSSADHDEIVARAEDFDLFIDATGPHDGVNHLGGRRSPGAAFGLVDLRASEARALGELVAEGAPRRPADLDALKDAKHPYGAKRIESARRKIDVPVGRGGWRAFHTIGTKDDRRYLFRPSPLLRYAVMTTLKPV